MKITDNMHYDDEIPKAKAPKTHPIAKTGNDLIGEPLPKLQVLRKIPISQLVLKFYVISNTITKY